MKEIRITENQDNGLNKLKFFSETPDDPKDYLDTEIVPDTTSAIKIVDLPQDPVTKKVLSKDVLNLLEKKIKYLITEQKTIHGTFDVLFENVRSAIIIINKNCKIIKVNKNFTKVTGFNKNELDNINIINLFSKKDGKKIVQLIKNLDSSPNSEISVAECLCKDKSTRFVEMNMATIPDQNRIMILMNDITEHKRYEQEILRRNRELTILNSISRSIKQPRDLQQILSLALEKTRLLIGMEMGAIYLGNRHVKNLHPLVTIGVTLDQAKKLLDQNLSVIKQIKKEKQDLFLNPANGSLWEIFNKKAKCRSIALLPLLIRKNTFGILVLASNKQIEFDEEKKQLLSAVGHQLAINIENAILFKDLEEKTREVEAKNKELSSFVFTVSHDLKTPLIALHGFLSLFSEEFQDLIDESGQEYFDRIFYNAEYMDKMINDLLKLSRAGRVVGIKRRFSTYKLAKEVYMCFYPQIQQKQVKFSISKDLPIIYGDRQRLQTVFENLISNAIKYASEDRHPYIAVDCNDRKTFYEFSVKDNGIGIDPADHQRIFEVFQKCGKRDDPKHGTGVGLTIVKKIIEHHGGSVWVDSKLDKGATFYFTLLKPSSI